MRPIRSAGLWLAACAIACSDDSGSRDDAAIRIVDAGPIADGALGTECLGADCDLSKLCCTDQPEPPRPFIGFCIEREMQENCPEKTLECDGPEDCDAGEGECCIMSSSVVCTGRGECATSLACHSDNHCTAGGSCRDTAVGAVQACQ